MQNLSENRYAKQILFRPIGLEGQKKISCSTVTIIGLGALGTVSGSHLCRAGVGKLRLVDRDFVEISNLQRQFLFDEKDAEKRMPKVVAAAEKLRLTNSDLEIEEHVVDVGPRNIEKLIEGSNLVIDGTDNLETRFIINDACLKHKIPWIYTSALGSLGMLFTIIPDHTPCLRCHIDQLPRPGLYPAVTPRGF